MALACMSDQVMRVLTNGLVVDRAHNSMTVEGVLGDFAFFLDIRRGTIGHFGHLAGVKIPCLDNGCVFFCCLGCGREDWLRIANGLGIGTGFCDIIAQCSKGLWCLFVPWHQIGYIQRRSAEQELE